MLHIIIPATPAVQLKPERYPLHPFWPPRLDREGGRGAWATHGSNKTSTASPGSVMLNLLSLLFLFFLFKS